MVLCEFLPLPALRGKLITPDSFKQIQRLTENFHFSFPMTAVPVAAKGNYPQLSNEGDTVAMVIIIT
jgi:hypothetical protein